MQESGENYLETILLLKQKQGFVRSIDVANALNYTKPSISRAISILKKSGYVRIEDGGNIVLTDTGQATAERIYERHRIITRYLTLLLGVEQTVADQDACRIEHVISQQTFARMKEQVDSHHPDDSRRM
ncbi:MAG: metal-dependent transcriptional regulator [Eubacteriales bacterium]|nr:metal-dependent transcriptional regulator [Eubacteriales bacterium]